MKRFGYNMQNTILFKNAVTARENAYVEYSHFPVGACLQTESGKLFSGCNVENAAYTVGICAEANAIGAMISAGERKIKQILVVVKGPELATPCGACRQRLFEFSQPETLIHTCNLDGVTQTYTLDTLLAHAFGPRALFS